MRVRFILLLAMAGAFCVSIGGAAQGWRHRIDGSEFQKSADGEWISPVVKPDFAFDELIYSWHLHKPGDTFRIYLKAVFAPGDETDWLNAGYWGAVKDLNTNRT